MIDSKTFKNNEFIFSEYDEIAIQATNSNNKFLYVDIKKKQNDKCVIYGPDL